MTTTSTKSAFATDTLAAWDGPGFSPCAFIALPPYAGLWALMRKLREQRLLAAQAVPESVRLERTAQIHSGLMLNSRSWLASKRAWFDTR